MASNTQCLECFAILPRGSDLASARPTSDFKIIKASEQMLDEGSFDQRSVVFSASRLCRRVFSIATGPNGIVSRFIIFTPVLEIGVVRSHSALPLVLRMMDDAAGWCGPAFRELP
ncbi:hypothetical protein AC630_39045 [Bradyrhizobium sp. AS23.2]|nr:hypothetical protein AC630_39045 [Bradyrhizobium sp. AS23.2]